MHRVRNTLQLFDYPMTGVGKSPGGVTVLLATSLAKDPGLVAAARTCLNAVDADVGALERLFGFKMPLSTLTIAPLSGLNDGTGGAYHYGCSGTVLYCDADGNNPLRTLALFVAELSEVGQAAARSGWACGATNGEGLSRVHAEAVHPSVLDDYSTAAAWLDGTRPNWVDHNEGTDQDDESNGCAVLFINWLHWKGYSYMAITQSGGASLAATYQGLTGKTTAWQDFLADVNGVWPTGKPSGVATDNPWPGVLPQPPPTPPGNPVILTLSGPLPAGTYVLQAK